MIHGDQAISGIRQFADSLVRLAVDLHNDGLFAIERPIITASGSAWYDLIAESFETHNAKGRFLSVLRPGSYVAHDHGIYKEAQCCVLDRRADLEEGLRPAMEVWAHVQSLPEPGFAVVALGKRDVAYDAGLPVPLRRYRAGAQASAGMTWGVQGHCGDGPACVSHGGAGSGAAHWRHHFLRYFAPLPDLRQMAHRVAGG